MNLKAGKFTLDLSSPKVMGIVNVTPDSFSDGGQFSQAEAAIAHGLALIEAGADILDIGGESTRPNATPVPLNEELYRVVPVIEALSSKVNIPLSIDTYKPAVMQAAIAAGASIVNDVRALQEDGAIDVVSDTDVAICLMHMQGMPQNMQDNPHYDDVVKDIKAFLKQRIDACIDAGVQQERLLLDPGFGFGKTRAHNIRLIQELEAFQDLGIPLLVGLSRKSVLGQVTGDGVDERLHASVAAATISAMKGASIVRVHDVKATAAALKVVAAIQ